jgi:hypothetical protein
MPKLQLLRTEDTNDGVFGTLALPNGQVLLTMEEDWNNNRPRVSCIPAGEYSLVRTLYRKRGYETFEITGVPGRSRCLVHPANTEEDVEGCVGVGLRRGPLMVHDEDDPRRPLVEKRAVLDSQIAFHQRFMPAMLGIDRALLKVEWAAHLPAERQ